MDLIKLLLGILAVFLVALIILSSGILSFAILTPSTLTFILQSSGSVCMGIVIMWVAFYFFNRAPAFTAKEFGEFIAVFFGGVVIQIFITQLNNDTKVIFWFYPIGLFFGIFLYRYLGGGNITLQKAS